MLQRRDFLLGGAAIALAAPVRAVAEDAYPRKPITIVVASAAGGGTDIMARLLAEAMHDDLGEPIIVDNKPGGGGNIGAAFVAHAQPDGYTLLMTAGALAIAPSVYEKLPFDPVKDLAGVAWIAIVPLVVVTKVGNGIETMQNLLALARRDGDKLTFGSFGTATPSHLAGESINQLAGTNLRHVPYNRGGAPLDTMSGAITISILDAVSTVPLVKAGNLKALAVTGPRRLAALPDIPTLAEVGIPFETVGWHAAFAPAATPAPIIERLNKAFTKALASSDMRQRIIAGGSVPIDPPLTAAQWEEQFRKDVESWAKVAHAAKVKVE